MIRFTWLSGARKLRDVRSESGVQYTVVGGEIVALSSGDKVRYWGSCRIRVIKRGICCLEGIKE